MDGDALLIGMGERYDAVVTLQDGAFPLVALPEGKEGQALAIVRTGSGDSPPAGSLPAELGGQLVMAGRLRAVEGVRFAPRELDRTHVVTLGMDMGSYRWTINGEVFGQHEPLPIRGGERTRLRTTPASGCCTVTTCTTARPA